LNLIAKNGIERKSESVRRELDMVDDGI
jgi:hypothetical protein